MNFQMKSAPNRSAIALRAMASQIMIPKKVYSANDQKPRKTAGIFPDKRPWARIASLSVSLCSAREIWTEQKAMIKLL